MINCRIGTEYLDLLEGSNVPIAITKAISKIGEIDKRHGDLSIGFDVAWTSKNVKLLNYVTVLNGSTTNESFKKVYGQLVEDDVVISDGFFRVEQFNQYDKNIKVRFFGGNSEWFSDIKGRKINESTQDGKYDVNGLINISISAQNIVNSFSTVLDHDNPYKFFLIDNNKDTTRNKTNETILNTFVDDYQLGFSQGVIADKIFESIDVKTQGDLFDDPKYYNTVITKSEALPQILADVKNVNHVSYLLGGTENEQSLPNSSSSTEPLRFIESSQVPEWDGTNILLNGDANGILINGSIQCRTENDNGTNRPLKIEVYKNGSIISSVTQTINETAYDDRGGFGANWFYLYNFSIDLSSYSLLEDDVLQVRYSSDFAPNRSFWTDLSNDTSVWNNRSFLSFKLLDYAKKESANIHLPDLNQDVFIKDMLTQFGVVTQYDAKTRTLTCNKLSLIEDRKQYAIDWSDKIDLSVKPNVNLTKLIENYGKRSFFKYSENDESDILNTIYSKVTNYRLGDGAINIDNDFLEDDKEVYTSPYSPTIMTATFPRTLLEGESYDLGNVYIPFVPLYTFTGVDDSNNREYDENDLNPKKFIYLDTFDVSTAFKGNVTTINVNDNFFDVQSTILPLVYFDKDDYPDFESSTLNSYTDSLSFSQLSELTVNYYDYGNTKIPKTTILGENYFFQNKILNKPIYLEIYLRLSPLDVQNVDFFTPIYLSFDLDSGYYYIDEISQYKGQDKSTKVKLVKI